MNMDLNPMYTRIHLATKSDVPFIHKMIHQMAIFEKLTHLFQATEESLTNTLFDSPPFTSTTVFLIEVSQTPLPLHHEPTRSLFEPIHKTFYTPDPINDPEVDHFGSGEAMIGGFVLFFPSYWTLMGKKAFYVDFLFVREMYRRKGLGKMLMKAVANEAVRLGYGRMEWNVLDWNVNAINLYEKIGAHVTKERRLCSLTGDALHSYGQPNY